MTAPPFETSWVACVAVLDGLGTLATPVYDGWHKCRVSHPEEQSPAHAGTRRTAPHPSGRVLLRRGKCWGTSRRHLPFLPACQISTHGPNIGRNIVVVRGGCIDGD